MSDASKAPFVIAFMTENQNKLREARRFAEGSGIEIVGLGLDVDETGLTFEENADLKVKAGVKALLENPGLIVDGKRPQAVFGEDSGLVIDALCGAKVGEWTLSSSFPGIKANRWLDDYGPRMRQFLGLPPIEGSAKSTDIERNQAVLTLMKGMKRRDTRYIAAISYVDLANPSQIEHFQGEMRLSVLPSEEPPRGENGFAYDTIMLVAEPDRTDLSEKTLAELPLEEKVALSHRGKALTGLFQYLSKQG